MVSVVIPAYNEEKCIEKCLDALVKQETTIKFEVIVVNNTSTDRTQELVKKYVRKLDLKLLDEKKKGRGSARHAGFQAASGNIIFSTDADTIVPIDWIEKIMGKFKKDTDAVSGTCKIVDCGKFTNLFFNAFQPLAMKGYRIVMGHYWLSGFNFAIRKSTYDKSGGFNKHLTSQEDIDLSFKVSKIGKILFAPDIPVIFSGRRFNNGILKGLFPYFQTYVEIFILKRQSNLSDIR